jgi:hypothetical protein
MTNDRDDLDAFFEDARGKGAAPDDAFLARLHSDADAALPAPKVIRFPEGPRVSKVWAGGGLLAAGVAGLAIGFGAPDVLNGLLMSDNRMIELADLLPSANPALVFGDVQ